MYTYVCVYIYVCVCVYMLYIYIYIYIVIVQSLSRVQLFVTPWTAACQLPLSFTISQSLLRFMSIGSLILSNHLNLCWPLLLLPSVFSSIRVFSNKLSLCIRWLKYWSFSFCPSNEYSALISLVINWFALVVQGDSQESSPAPQFESINSLACSLLYGPTLTSVCDY